MTADLPQRLAAILAADIAGYTRLMEFDEAGTVAAWRRARAEVIDPTVEQHRGRIVKLTGDGFLAEFSTVESAVRAALTMQQSFSALFASQPADHRVAFRMGVDIGDIWVDAQDVYGAGVNVAARLEALALPGELCISDAVHAAIKHKIVARYEDIGPQRVKNVAAPVRAWRVGQAADASSAGAQRRSRPWHVGLAIAATLLAATALVLYLSRPPATSSLTGTNALATVENPAPGVALTAVAVHPDSIAVLPFYNIDGTEDMRIFCDGLAEDVIGRLTVIPQLRVSSRGDSFALGANSASQDVRDRLRVAYYLEGSVRQTGETLRIVAQLIDSATGFHVVSRTFDKTIGEFSEIQDEITNLIVANLRVALPSLTEAPVYMTAETASFDAYLAFRRGMDIVHRPMTRQAIEQALDAFRESLTVDPDYAAAYAGICLTYTAAYDVTRETAYIGQAERSCGSALERSPNLIVVHDALGELYLRMGRYAEAERAFERALTLNANDVPALTGLADAYLGQQRVAEAEQRYRQAVGLQPGNWRTYNSLGNFLYANGRYAEAAEAYGEVVAVDRGNATGWANLASSSMLTGDFAQAAHAFERAMEVQPSPRTLMNLGMMHYYLGEAGLAKAALEKAIEMAPQDYLAWSNLGDVLAFSGDSAAAHSAFIEAERLAREQLEVNSRDPGRIIDLAWITAMLGRLDEAERLIDTALTLAPTDPYVHYYDALVRVRMGEAEAALDRLETAVEMGYSRAMIRAEPHFAELRDRERFAELIGD
ncbi:MAG TPA: tetratricopeptide repeat protein [Gammaproteobacteria bacterium]